MFRGIYSLNYFYEFSWLILKFEFSSDMFRVSDSLLLASFLPSWQSQWWLFKLPLSITLTYCLSQSYVLCIPPPPPPPPPPSHISPTCQPSYLTAHYCTCTHRPRILLIPVLVLVRINHQFLQKKITKTTFGHDPNPAVIWGQCFNNHWIKKMICFKSTSNIQPIVQSNIHSGIESLNKRDWKIFQILILFVSFSLYVWRERWENRKIRTTNRSCFATDYEWRVTVDVRKVNTTLILHSLKTTSPTLLYHWEIFF